MAIKSQRGGSVTDAARTAKKRHPQWTQSIDRLRKIAARPKPKKVGRG